MPGLWAGAESLTKISLSGLGSQQASAQGSLSLDQDNLVIVNRYSMEKEKGERTKGIRNKVDSMGPILTSATKKNE